MVKLDITSLCVIWIAASTTSSSHDITQTAYETAVELSLYDGNDIEEYLNLCQPPSSGAIEANDFDSLYHVTSTNATLRTELECDVIFKGTHDGMNAEEKLEFVHLRYGRLRYGQTTVTQYRKILLERNYIPHIVILCLIILCGSYLIIVGHYKLRTIIDSYHPDGSDGMPCWQYLRMRYIAARVKGNVTNKTILVPTDGKQVQKEKIDEKPKVKKKKSKPKAKAPEPKKAWRF